MSEKLTAPSPHAKPPEYLDINGAESLIPAVQEIGEVLKTGETFIVVGGGSSGKTESLTTALEQQQKKHTFLDLRNWTVAQLSQESVRADLLADPELSEEARGYIVGLGERLLNGEADAAQAVRTDYWADTSLGIKYAESHLLDREITRAASEPGTDHEEGIMADVEGDVVVLDEFDLSIGDELEPVEVDNAVKLIKLAKALTDAQLGMVIHPAAIKDPHFSSVVREALGEPSEPRVVMMQHFPRQVEQASLASVGIEGEQADRLMQDIQGLPAAYLGIAAKPEFKEGLQAAPPEERVAMLEAYVEKKLSSNMFIYDRLSEPTKEYLVSTVSGEHVSAPSDAVVQEALVNLYVSARDGEITMPPIVRRVLGRELGIDVTTA